MLNGGRNSLTISFSIKSTTRKLTRGIGDEGYAIEQLNIKKVIFKREYFLNRILNLPLDSV
jgi:hypothetical protein